VKGQDGKTRDHASCRTIVTTSGCEGAEFSASTRVMML
jgi:hypothetical protein